MDGIDFSKLEAKVVLLEDALPEYEHGMNILYNEELVPLNATIHVMVQIIQFPRLFIDPGSDIFFPLLIGNSFVAALLTITRLATDKKGDLFTLLQFKNWVREQVKPEYRTEFQRYLKRSRFDKETRSLFKKAKNLRDSRIAHIKRDFEVSERDRLDFEELKILRDSLNSILEILSFNVERAWLPIPYSPRVNDPNDIGRRSDIDKILDSIARDSTILNLPENEPHYWSVYRKNLSGQELEVLNKYRARFNLSEV